MDSDINQQPIPTVGKRPSPWHESSDPKRLATKPNPSSTALRNSIREECLPWIDSTPGSNCTDPLDPKPKCFRISNIPSTWTEDQVYGFLKSLDRSSRWLQTGYIQLSLYPACYGASTTKVALLNLKECPEYFLRHIRPYEPHTVRHLDVDLIIDDHFYGLTPLNNSEDISADVIAVTGLSGHAFGSWRNRTTNKMWLQDFLPQDIKNIRIMTYGYNTNLVGANAGHYRILDHQRDLIEQLDSARSSPEEKIRPIIFLGHSFGGILILSTLLQSRNQSLYKHVLEATCGLVFFGVPHHGLHITELEAMVDDMSSGQQSAAKNIIRQLGEHSEFLERQANYLVDILRNIEVVSFYETLKTPTVQKSSVTGRYERSGDLIEMVNRFSALLHLPNEHRIPVPHNHTDMVKFPATSDTTYQSVVNHVRQFLDDIVQHGGNQWTGASYTRSADEDACLKSLNESDYRSYRDNLLDKRHENTCDWLLADERYNSWLTSADSHLLWVHGGPGCGKSVLLSYLSSKLVSTYTGRAKGDTPLVIYFFCDDKDESLKTATAILQNLVVQILRQAPKYFRNVLPECSISKARDRARDKSTCTWTFGQLWRIFSAIISDVDGGLVYCLIDALDECEETSREKLLLQLQRLLHQFPNKGFKMLITSRPHVPVMEGFIHATEIALTASNLDKDIQCFVDNEVQLLARKKDLSDSTKLKIRNILVGGADGMFLWVSLILDDLKKFPSTRNDLNLRRLQQLPKNLPDMYRKILNEINSEFREDALAILYWIVYAVRPLTLDELAVAIAVRPEYTSMSTMGDHIERNMKYFLNSLFGPLIKIGDNNTANLVHQSAKDFLISGNLHKEGNLLDSKIFQDGGSFYFHVDPTVANLQLALACLRYLSLDEFEEEPVTAIFENLGEREHVLRRYPFLEYAARYWCEHANQTDHEHCERDELCSAFWLVAKSSDKINLAYCIAGLPRSIGFCEFAISKDVHLFMPPLQIAASFGSVLFVDQILDSGADVNDQDSVYGTALMGASFHGHLDVVRRLVGRGADVNTLVDDFIGNALQMAIISYDEDMIRLLIDLGADVNASGGNFDTALQVAVAFGDCTIIELLVDLGGDVNAQGGKEYGTALMAAVDMGKIETIRSLVECGADINAQTSEGLGSALCGAARRGDLEVFQLLVELGADVNAPGGYYGSVLQAAAAGGNLAIFRFLLDCGCDIDIYAQTDKIGNLIQAAAFGGNNIIVRLLVDLGADVNTETARYCNALPAAAHGGNREIFQLLIKLGADINSQGGYFGCVLQAAVTAKQGVTAAVQQLIDLGANVNIQGGIYGSALQAAVYFDHGDVVRLLLKHGADVNVLGGKYGSALQAAAFSGNTAITQKLIDLGANVNTQGGIYGNALQAAASKGYCGKIWLLFEHGANVNAQGGRYGNALQAAVVSGKLEAVELLLELGANINAQGGEYGNALQAARHENKSEMVKLLEGRGAN